MKLSFSTRGWHENTFNEFCDIASELKFDGIELHNIYNRLFTDKNGAFQDYAISSTLRNLYEKDLKIPCIDTLCNIADETTQEKSIAEITKCITLAESLHIPYIRVKSCGNQDKIEVVYSLISKVLPIAEKAGVTLLIETSGTFASSATLRNFLDRFACDNLSALWNISLAYYGAKESAEEVIKNLGAYVKHVQMNDCKQTDGNIEYCLMGEGELPINEIMLALRSVNYDGFLSLVWDPTWCEELDDMEIIFSQFVGFMRQFSDTSRNQKTYYYNKARTGKFVWKKDLLIDATFSEVLDKMVEEFPDQYAFKYTTLDYTRTYSEFRDDVDTFARSLISMGVKAGSHVAVWATNVPQWYIAFWAVTKIGGVLVSAKKKGNDIYGVKLKAKKDLTIKVKNVFGKDQITLASKNGSICAKEDNQYFTINLKKGETKII